MHEVIKINKYYYNEKNKTYKKNYILFLKTKVFRSDRLRLTEVSIHWIL